jgi:hypothetical protein
MEFIRSGGMWYTIPILILGVSAVALVVTAVTRAIQRKPKSVFMNDAILFMGFLSLAWGIFGQISGMFQAAGAIVRAGEISPDLIWQGLRVSLIPVIMGFVVLFISAISWFFLRSFRKAA